MIKDFLEPYFDESELKRLKEIVSKAKELKRTNGTSQEELDKVLFSLRYEILSLETKAFSRYTKQNDDTAILKDCLEIIQAVEPKDFSKNKFAAKKQPSDIVKFSFGISNNTDISYIENYFSETKNNGAISEILFAIYDRTLVFYPDGFSDQDKKSSYCIFDRDFFKALEKRESQEPVLNPNEKIKIKGFLTIKDTPMIQALQDVTKVSKRELENPNQISLFDLNRQVDTWNESENHSPNARKITILKNSKTRTKFKLTFAVEDYKELLKGNANAHKLIALMSEKWLDSKQDQNQNTRVLISIHEFAERLGTKDDRDARDTLKTVSKMLKSLKFETGDGGYIYVFPAFFVGQKEMPNGQKVGVRGHAAIDVSSYVDLSDGGEFTKSMPLYIWQLSKNAWFLAFYIYSIMRNDAKNISPDKRIHTKKINLLTILPVLNLPHPSETNRITQLIIKPLSDAVNEINKIEEKNHGSLVLDLKIDNQKAPTDQVLDGYLLATVKSGAYLDSLKETSQKRLDHKADGLKRQQEKEKRIDSAKGREFARLEKREKKKKDQS